MRVVPDIVCFYNRTIQGTLKNGAGAAMLSSTVVVIILASIHVKQMLVCSNGTPAIFYRAPLRSCSYLLRQHNELEIEKR